MPLPGQSESLWQNSAGVSSYPRLDSDLNVDVAILGGGITGITTATLLARAGKRVAVIEKSRIAAGETGLTTAHLSEVIDARYTELIRDFGNTGARLLVASSRASLEMIAGLIAEYAIECHFERVPGYLYTENPEQVLRLRADAEAAQRLGVAAAFTGEIPLPFRTHGAIRFDDQAQFHPREYLLSLARALPGQIYEMTEVRSIADGHPCRIETDGGTVLAHDVVVATNVPINNRVLLHTKIAAYRSYAVAAPLAEGFVPKGLYWDTEDPYHYTRRQTTANGEFVIVGGEDHRTGEERDAEDHFRRLAEYVFSHFHIGAIAYRWSGQIIEPVDGLPYIGRNPHSQHVFVATGFSGNGMTFGTLSAMILGDLILGRDNPFAPLYDPARVKPVASIVDYATENLAFPKHLVADTLAQSDVETRSLEDIRRDEGKIVRHRGKTLAVYRDATGRMFGLSPICPHLGCHVHWNNAEKSWDCPCHGSRFSATGKLLNGPAKVGLAAVELEPRTRIQSRP